MKNKQEVFYHWAPRKHRESILKKGIIKNKMGIVYISNKRDAWKKLYDDTVLFKVIVPDGIRLSCFEEYIDGTEILCWGSIPKENIVEIN